MDSVAWKVIKLSSFTDGQLAKHHPVVGDRIKQLNLYLFFIYHYSQFCSQKSSSSSPSLLQKIFVFPFLYSSEWRYHVWQVQHCHQHCKLTNSDCSSLDPGECISLKPRVLSKPECFPGVFCSKESWMGDFSQITSIFMYNKWPSQISFTLFLWVGMNLLNRLFILCVQISWWTKRTPFRAPFLTRI